jgi:N-acetylneuraminate synthase
VKYAVAASENAIRPLRRSLYVVQDVAAGEAFTEQNVRSIRPGLGLAPKHLPDVIGQAASRALKRGTPLDWSMIARE